jgi:hypothetical protein
VRRFAPAVSLFLLSPLVAEFLLGNLPITLVGALVALAPMYGGGALLIRETARRAGLGWPSILLLALGYGLVEEGLVTQSLVNPNYAGQHLLRPGFVPVLGIGAPWTVFVLTLHVVWSIATPIALVESMSRRPTAPWLGRLGLTVVGVLFAVGLAGERGLHPRHGLLRRAVAAAGSRRDPRDRAGGRRAARRSPWSRAPAGRAGGRRPPPCAVRAGGRGAGTVGRLGVPDHRLAA